MPFRKTVGTVTTCTGTTVSVSSMVILPVSVSYGKASDD